MRPARRGRARAHRGIARTDAGRARRPGPAVRHPAGRRADGAAGTRTCRPARAARRRARSVALTLSEPGVCPLAWALARLASSLTMSSRYAECVGVLAGHLGQARPTDRQYSRPPSRSSIATRRLSHREVLTGRATAALAGSSFLLPQSGLILWVEHCSHIDEHFPEMIRVVQSWIPGGHVRPIGRRTGSPSIDFTGGSFTHGPAQPRGPLKSPEVAKTGNLPEFHENRCCLSPCQGQDDQQVSGPRLRGSGFVRPYSGFAGQERIGRSRSTISRCSGRSTQAAEARRRHRQGASKAPTS